MRLTALRKGDSKKIVSVLRQKAQTLELSRFPHKRSNGFLLMCTHGNIIFYDFSYPRCLFYHVATKKASSLAQIYQGLYTFRNPIRIQLMVGVTTCLNLVNKLVRMFSPRATSLLYLRGSRFRYGV